MKRHSRRTLLGCTAVVLGTIALGHGIAHAQAAAPPTREEVLRQYMSRGADMTTVQPGSAYYSNGADATTVNAKGRESPYYSNGAQVTNVANQGAASKYYSNGADATTVNVKGRESPYYSNGAQVTNVANQGAASAYYSNGAAATTVNVKGRESPYFSNGAAVTTVNSQGLPTYFAKHPPPAPEAVPPVEHANPAPPSAAPVPPAPPSPTLEKAPAPRSNSVPAQPPASAVPATPGPEPAMQAQPPSLGTTAATSELGRSELMLVGEAPVRAVPISEEKVASPVPGERTAPLIASHHAAEVPSAAVAHVARQESSLGRFLGRLAVGTLLGSIALLLLTAASVALVLRSRK
jgi:hypothetical protein